MKLHNFIYFGLFSLVLFTITNCEKLDYDESTGNKKEDVFNEFARSKNFLTGIYAYLPTDFNSIDGAMRAAASDEAEHVNDVSNIQKFNEGSYSATLPIDNVWGNMYTAIRACNMFIEESKGQTFPELEFTATYANDIKQYNNYPYEARFLRAFFYFELLKRYKNIPLITTVLTPEESVNLEQASYEKTVEFIVSECDAVAKVLPLSYIDFTNTSSETGRATKGAALALKSRVLLYAASPLHNTSNDLVLWQKAASAAKEVIDLNIYALVTSYSANFNVTSASPIRELIFERREATFRNNNTFPTSNDFERRNYPVGYEGGQTGTCPTQNLVDSYEMSRSGLATGTKDSGFNPALPFNGRDARLAQTIILNNTTWKGSVVQVFFGGRNALPIPNATKTGYYLKKYVNESTNLDPKNGVITFSEHTWVLFRYSEILLNFAEAMNEAYGPDDASTLGLTARQAVDQVRNRVQMSRFPGPGNNSVPVNLVSLNQADFRTKLRNERRVELAFEDHRFWDVRRWKIGKETEDIFGTIVTRNPTNPNRFIYTTKLLERRPFADRMNLYPIPLNEILKNNKKWEQNTGW